MTKYETKDSGKRADFPSGMRRDTADNKPRYDLIWLPGLKRFAELLGRGADKYGDNNWQKANSPEELARFRASAWRHFTQYMAGERDEDHMAAVVFNLFACEYVTERMRENSLYRTTIPGKFVPAGMSLDDILNNLRTGEGTAE